MQQIYTGIIIINELRRYTMKDFNTGPNVKIFFTKSNCTIVTPNSAIKVEIAAPTHPNFGINNRFNNKLIIAPATDEYNLYISFPTERNIFIPIYELIPIINTIGFIIIIGKTA